jgi:hypothetical protein
MKMKKLELNPLQQPDKIINYWKKEPVAVAFIVIFGIGYKIPIMILTKSILH